MKAVFMPSSDFIDSSFKRQKNRDYASLLTPKEKKIKL